MKYKLTRDDKIILLNALKSGEIEEHILWEWGHNAMHQATEEEINEEIDKIYKIDNGERCCKRMQRLGFCPYVKPT
ncbi:MAG: hypothetical protein J5676_06270 [Bacteroidaceae bacterium]|nr:hypothetical protein [Bacteroidaceae bacterium]